MKNKISYNIYIIFILSVIALIYISSPYILGVMFIICVLTSIITYSRTIELSNRIDVISSCDPQYDLKKLKAELLIYDSVKNISMSLIFVIICLLLKQLK